MEHGASSIQQPASSIAWSIRHPASSIQQPASNPQHPSPTVHHKNAECATASARAMTSFIRCLLAGLLTVPARCCYCCYCCCCCCCSLLPSPSCSPSSRWGWLLVLQQGSRLRLLQATPGIDARSLACLPVAAHHTPVSLSASLPALSLCRASSALRPALPQHWLICNAFQGVQEPPSACPRAPLLSVLWHRPQITGPCVHACPSLAPNNKSSAV